MKTKLISLLLAAQALFVGAACAATYTFTNLLDNTGDFAVFYHCAAINQSGGVAFHPRSAQYGRARQKQIPISSSSRWTKASAESRNVV